MLPDKKVVDGDIAELRIVLVGPQQAEPVLSGNDVDWVDGGFSPAQSIQELLQLGWTQRVDVLPHNSCFPLVTVRSCPAKLTLTTVKPSKITCLQCRNS